MEKTAERETGVGDDSKRWPRRYALLPTNNNNNNNSRGPPGFPQNRPNPRVPHPDPFGSVRRTVSPPSRPSGFASNRCRDGGNECAMRPFVFRSSDSPPFGRRAAARGWLVPYKRLYKIRTGAYKVLQIKHQATRYKIHY